MCLPISPPGRMAGGGDVLAPMMGSGERGALLTSAMAIRWDGILKGNMEAEVGIEPASTALQAAA